MNYDPPVDQLVVPINVPKGIWLLYEILASPLYLMVSYYLT